jgi:hypothetical protein
MDSLKDLLASKNLDEPTEISALREYCQKQFNFTPKISVKKDALWLLAPNGILATELRMCSRDIIKRCGITTKLIIRIG